jgi:hypothetical protein
MISFDSFKKNAGSFNDDKLFCLLTGVRGAGKSTAIGTLNVPTFLIASALESHAIEAAKLLNSNIIPTLYDVDDNGKQLKPDAALINLNNILDFLISSDDLLKNVEAIALDSMSAVDKTLLETSRVLSEKNGFEKMKIVEQEHLKIIKKLKEIHRRKVHVLATMPIMAIYDENGLYASAKPELSGVTTTSNIAGNFNDVLVVGCMNGQYVFQMDLLIKKTGKEMSGADKQIVFHPRITGLSKQDLIAAAGEALLLPADLDYVYQLKKAKKGVSE